MDFRILGPVEVLSEGQQLRLAGQKQRALLAYLLLHANGAVPAERLLDELWPEPPSGGAAALQSQVSRLRKILGERIVSTGSGYAIRIEPGELDLERFRSLLAEAGATGDPAQRSQALRSAEGLWRGTPLDGVEAPFAAAETAALEDLRLAALEDRIEADLELGRDGELVSELAALVQRYPLRERLRANLILALYRSGRQADALETYRETRRILNDELGLEPSPTLRELERAILRHDPALARVRRPTAAPAATKPSRRRASIVAAIALLMLVSAAAAAVTLTRGHGHAPQAAPTSSVQPQQNTSPAGRAHIKSTEATSSGATRRHTPKSRVHVTIRSALPPRRTTPTTTTAPTARTQSTPAAATPPARKASKPASKPVTISDDFAGNQIDGTIWLPTRFGTGWTMAEQNGHLEFTFTPSTAGDSRDGDYGGLVGTLCKFPGDFDAHVHFTLAEWPAGNGITAELASFLGRRQDGWAIARRSAAQWGEQYTSYTATATSVQLDDLSGTLRIARRDGIVTAYFRHNGRWDSLTSGRNTGLAVIGVSAIGGPGYNIGPFGGERVVVDFDHFSATGSSPICPPGSQPSA
jgi:DNA-binding SARP family transcriptional activator